ncbi:MAG: peptidoglycan DD-metalloendopeptidase family protein [Microgenomates group bacterium]
MASEKDIVIQQLYQVIDLLVSQKAAASLTKDDLKIFSVAQKYFGEKYFFLNNYSKFLKNLPLSAVTDYLASLEKQAKKEKKEVIKKETPKEQEASIPPEIEALVAEYQQNLALLESEEVKSSSQKTVAEQVKIAIAHSKIKKLALANRERRQSQGENFKKVDDLLVSLGSPKSESKKEALNSSFTAVKQVADTYAGFSKLSPKLQEQIISSATELNLIGIRDLDTAVQASTLQIDVSSLEGSDKTNIATIPGGFISTIYQEVTSLNNQALESETKISDNEQRIISLQDEIPSLPKSEKEKLSLEIKNLLAENEQLSASIESQSTQFTSLIAKQTDSFKDFEKSREERLSQDPDLQDRIELSNKNIVSIHNNLENNGIRPHLPTPMDDAHLLEEAIRHNFPGVLLPNSGYQAEYAAGLLNTPQTQTSGLSPQAILLYGKELTPQLLTKTRLFAQKNPNSALGKLYSTRKDIFDSTSSQIRKISTSPLGKEISKASTGVSRTFGSVSKFFGKVSDRIPGGIGTVFRVIQDPWGSLRSWAGQKAGEFIARQLVQRLTNETLKKGAEMLLKDGLKETLKKFAQQAATQATLKVGAKVGIKIALETGAQAANVVPGLGLLLAVLIDISFWVGEKIIGFTKALAKSIYGEEVKTRDVLALPAAGFASFAGGVVSFFSGIGTTTVIAASSAVGIITAGTIIVFFFYVTSIVVAPLISTLVQLESTPKTAYTGTILPGCPNTWPVGEGYILTQGPGGKGSHGNTGYDQSIDIGTPIGTPVISTTFGVVSFAGFSPEYLNTDILIIDSALEDGTAFKVVYAHLTSIDVAIGGSVEIGSILGTTGTAGTGPHLHYEYKDLLYNQCPAGGLQLSENCPEGELYPGLTSCSNRPQVYTN